MFGLAIGNFNTLATIIQPLIQPFGFNNNDSSVCGAMLVLLGIIGAAVYGFILDKYQNYKKLLLISNSLFIFGFLLFILGMFTSQYLLYLSAAIMGFNVFPVIPISFELGCELTFPVGEAFSSGILMTAS
jgi:MFS family permease